MSQVRLIILGLLCSSSAVYAQAGGERAARPNWSEKDTRDIFYEDAFRDVFGGKSPFAPLAPDTAAGTSAGPSRPSFDATTATTSDPELWTQALHSPLLIDEITAIAASSQKATRSARSFAGDARDEVRRDFVIAATLLRALGEWRGDVRFKKHSAAASAALAQAASALDVQSGEALQQAKRAAADLQDLVRGNRSPTGTAQPPDWKQLVHRADFMWRLELAVEEVIADGLESEKTLQKNNAAMAQDANLVAALLLALRQATAIDAEHADYADFSRAAQANAMQLRDAILEQDFAGSKTSLQKLRQSCEACHENYQ